MATEFYAPSSADVLRMENDLLKHEVSYLQARLDRHDGDEGLPGVAATDRELEKAYHDIRWFVRRLTRSPIGPLLRLWPGFRTLQHRYLDDE